MAQQRRAQETRDKILRTAAGLFGELGYSATSTTMIIEHSGVTRGALHYHFPNKEDIADAVIAAQDEVLNIPERTSYIQSLVALTYLYARHLQDDPLLQGVARLSVDETYDPKIDPYESPLTVVTQLLHQARANNELLPQVIPEDYAEHLQAAYTGIQLISWRKTKRRDLIERITYMWRNYLPSFVVQGLIPFVVLPDLPGDQSPTTRP